MISARFTNGPRGLPFRSRAFIAGLGRRARGAVERALPPATMMTGVQNADRAKLIQSGSLEGLGPDVARYVEFVRAPTARRPRCATRLCHDLSRGLRAESEIRAWGVAETTLRGVARLDARVFRHRRVRRARPLFFHRARAFPRSPPLPHPPLPSRANLVHLSSPAAASGWRSGRRARTRTARA